MAWNSLRRTKSLTHRSVRTVFFSTRFLSVATWRRRSMWILQSTTSTLMWTLIPRVISSGSTSKPRIPLKTSNTLSTSEISLSLFPYIGQGWKSWWSRKSDARKRNAPTRIHQRTGFPSVTRCAIGGQTSREAAGGSPAHSTWMMRRMLMRYWTTWTYLMGWLLWIMGTIMRRRYRALGYKGSPNLPTLLLMLRILPPG